MGDLSPTPLPTAQLSCRSGITAKKEYALTTGTVGTVQSTKTYTYGDSTWKDLLTDYNGAALSYDTVGNVTGDGTWTYTWQHGRQLSGMSKSGTTASFVYNADGQRISKTVNGTTTQYHYANGKLSHVVKGSEFLHINYDALGPWFVNYDNGTTSTVHYFLRNAQGDILGLVNAHGVVVVSYTYDAWGNVLSVTGSMAGTLGTLNPLRYRGYVYDTETKLYYLNSRYYNPATGRFVNADIFVSTGQGVLGSNMFAYCNNNPVMYVDPSGAIAIVDDLAIAGILGLGLLFFGGCQLLYTINNPGNRRGLAECLEDVYYEGQELFFTAMDTIIEIFTPREYPEPIVEATKQRDPDPYAR